MFGTRLFLFKWRIGREHRFQVGWRRTLRCERSRICAHTTTECCFADVTFPLTHKYTHTVVWPQSATAWPLLRCQHEQEPERKVNYQTHWCWATQYNNIKLTLSVLLAQICAVSTSRNPAETSELFMLWLHRDYWFLTSLLTPWLFSLVCMVFNCQICYDK